MKITVIISLLAAIAYAADVKSKEKNSTSKTDKRDLLEGNYGDRTYLKNVLRPVQSINYSNNEDELAGRPSNVYSPSSPPIAKISDVLSSEGPHYSAISDYLFSPVSAYQSKLPSPPLVQNSELGYIESEYKSKSSKKHKKSKSPPKRTYSTYEPQLFQFDTLSNFANYDASQFRNLYQIPNTFDRGLFSPRAFPEQSFARPVTRPAIAPQYYPQIYQQPQVYQQGLLQSQRQYNQPIQYLQQQIPNVAYSQESQQVVPNLAFTQGLQQAAPGVAYIQGAQQSIPGASYAQNTQQVVPGVAYAQGAQQIIPGLVYPQRGQQILPGVAYVQEPQRSGVTYAYQQNQQVEANVQPQLFRIAPQQQPAPQKHIHAPQQTQGAVSYASFSQSLPPYSQPQPYAHPQEQQTPQIQHTQGQTYLVPVRPEVSEVQSLQQVPDSQPQSQQISDSHPQPTSQPNEEQTVTAVPDKGLNEPVQLSTQNLQSESSIVEATTQSAPQEINHSQPTKAPTEISTQPNLVQSQLQLQILRELSLQQAADRELSYVQQVPQVYSEDLYQQPALVDRAVAPTFPQVQYFGNYAESLFRNYH